MALSGSTGLARARQEISGAVTSALVRIVRAQAGEIGLAHTLGIAGERRPAEVLEDPRTWSTQEEVVSLLSAAAQVAKDPDLARHVGEEILRQHDGTDVADLLRSLGSPAELLRNVAAASARFTTVSTLEPIEVGDSHAVVRAQARPGHVRPLVMCEFTKGLLSQVPCLFDLVPALVTESECQALGGRFCLYSVTWEAHWSTFADDRDDLFTVAWENKTGVVEARAELKPGPADRVAELEEQLAQMGERLEEVFSTASDLLSVHDLHELLKRITRRAAQAVNAPSYLLVVQVAPEEPLHLHHHGFAEHEAQALAEELWLPSPDDAGGSRLIVDIASSRQRYGRLAAIQPKGKGFVAHEREILSLYANYAAAALDLVTTLAESRRSTETANALLDFSRALARVGTTDEVSQTLADTVPAVIRCERSAVLMWDPFEQHLILKAVGGQGSEAHHRPEPKPAANPHEPIVLDVTKEWEDEEEEETPPFTLSPSQTPVIERLMSSRDIAVIDKTATDPVVLAALEEYGTEVSILAPLFAAASSSA